MYFWLAKMILSMFVASQICQFSNAASTASYNHPNVDKVESFSPAQLKVLHVLSNYILASEEYDPKNPEERWSSYSMGDTSPYSKTRPLKMAKRNSELLNSLLGLPKNILRSGRK
ncbi:hypothetical protein TCAL_15107 [Tigriopus californicus]|uniref:Calcitonin peptide-like domain-containing protein n=1 Tax=Tigriopus californicus TaxID=6832 RepID=A0A553NTE9_TIGCA|nr:uncharacterized protein LOC131879167 [Tigriopus californicus]TRY68699.1 hypothetical protein TCAL_15107 [Tigriopus californicus]